MWHANFRHQISRLSAERYREMDIEFVHFPPFRRFLLVKPALVWHLAQNRTTTTLQLEQQMHSGKNISWQFLFFGVHMALLSV